MADLPHPWRMLGDGRIALAFPMPETPVFVAAVLEHNRRRMITEVSTAAKMVNGGASSTQIALAGLRRLARKDDEMRRFLGTLGF